MGNPNTEHIEEINLKSNKESIREAFENLINVKNKEQYILLSQATSKLAHEYHEKQNDPQHAPGKLIYAILAVMLIDLSDIFLKTAGE